MSRALWWMIGLGTALRLVLAFKEFGIVDDINATATVVRGLIDGDPFDVYADLRTDPVPTWPYPPGFFPFALLSAGLARTLPGDWHAWIHLTPILADAALALVVQRILAHRGHTERVQLAGAALVAFGPVFANVSGYLYQIDAVAVLPALIGVFAWDTRRTADRALVAGLLIGLAATVKSPLGLLLFAVLPTARSVREAAVVSGCAIGVPLVALAPFLLSDLRGTLDQVLGHEAVAGQAMLSAVVDSDVTALWVQPGDFTDYHSTLAPLAPLLLAGVLAFVLVVGLRYRPPAMALAVVLYMAVWAFGSGFFFHYLIWGLPFLLASARLWEAALLQAMAIVAWFVLLTGPHSDTVLAAYRIWVYSLLAVTVVLLVRSVRAMRPA